MTDITIKMSRSESGWEIIVDDGGVDTVTLAGLMMLNAADMLLQEGHSKRQVLLGASLAVATADRIRGGAGDD